MGFLHAGSFRIRSSTSEKIKNATERGGGEGASEFCGSRILDKIGDELWTFDLIPEDCGLEIATA